MIKGSSSGNMVRVMAAVALLSVTPGVVQADRARDVRMAVRQEMLKSKATGCSVAIAQNGQVVFQHGFGYGDVENFVQVRPQTVFRIASISKPITAIAIMQLVQQGKVDLDADIREYVPEFPDKDAKITARQVLAHLSGIRSYVGGEAASMKAYASVEESLGMFKNDPLEHAPGEKYLYSTHAFTLTARVVENVTGMSYPEYLRQHVFAPAGMDSTGPEEVRSIVRWRAKGYVRTQNGELLNSAYTDISYKWGGGGLVSTAPDLCRLGMALMHGTLMSEDSRRTMWTEQKTSEGKGTGYGLGWSLGEVDGKFVAAHGGAQPSTRAYLGLVPEEGLVVAVLSNYENFQPSPLAARILEIWRGGEASTASSR